ncbi:MAG: prolyl oligopeptidase family serine peptidase [candidate division Zixibacteria bacterium]|nr:prolyl oligopeptidase family serine peptidase [candidate division Zixibacteria bacterium]
MITENRIMMYNINIKKGVVVKIALLLSIIFLMVPAVQGEVITKTVMYKHGDTELEGYMAWDNSISGKRPGVLVVHEWTGINDYTKKRVRQLADSGYVAFAVDMYGKGIRPSNAKEASEQATIYRSDRDLMRARVNAGLDVLLKNELCDKKRVAAIGYCFGGGTVLELARSGAYIAGVVSFHGNLDTPEPEAAENIRSKILVCHGAEDPYVPDEQVDAFFDEMSAADVDFQFIAYSGAVHSFTNPNSGEDPSKGAAYNQTADRRSWKHMLVFFNEIFE